MEDAMPGREHDLIELGVASVETLGADQPPSQEAFQRRNQADSISLD